MLFMICAVMLGISCAQVAQLGGNEVTDSVVLVVCSSLVLLASALGLVGVQRLQRDLQEDEDGKETRAQRILEIYFWMVSRALLEPHEEARRVDPLTVETPAHPHLLDLLLASGGIVLLHHLHPGHHFHRSRAWQPRQRHLKRGTEASKDFPAARILARARTFAEHGRG